MRCSNKQVFCMARRTPSQRCSNTFGSWSTFCAPSGGVVLAVVIVFVMFFVCVRAGDPNKRAASEKKKNVAGIINPQVASCNFDKRIPTVHS